MTTPTGAQKLDHVVTRIRDLLAEEKQAELAQTQTLLETLPPAKLRERGLMLTRLVVVSSRTGYGGKKILAMSPSAPNASLATHRFSSGDIVSVRDEEDDTVAFTAVVGKVTDTVVEIALGNLETERFTPHGPASYTLFLVTNDTTYKRMERALRRLEDASNFNHPLVQLVFNQSPPRAPKAASTLPANHGLNSSQAAAVEFALASNGVALIHGPPGTGKTTALVQFILATCARGERVLACAPSNLAIDNLAQPLIKSRAVSVVRIGHPARFLPEVAPHCLENVIGRSNGGEVVGGVKEDMAGLEAEIAGMKGGRAAKWREWRQLRTELKRRERKAADDVLKETNVVLATLSGAGGNVLARLNDFDVVVIDEAAQAVEALCWIAILKGKKIVFAGDHLQLPPTIHSKAAAKKGLELTLFERIIRKYSASLSKVLTIQYRMNEKIMQWASDQLYNSLLTAHSSVAQRLLSDLPDVTHSSCTSTPLIFVDTLGCDMWDAVDDEGSSYNDGEVEIVSKIIAELVQSGVDSSHISIIAPYRAQVRAVKHRLAEQQYADIPVNTVDGYQGREMEVVIISCTRSNTEGNLGFMKERRRMNVAVTRAKRLCVVIGDSDCLSRDQFLKTLVDYFMENGEYWSASQYADASPNPRPIQSREDLPSVSGPSATLPVPTPAPSSASTPNSNPTIALLETFLTSSEVSHRFTRPLSQLNEGLLQQFVKENSLFLQERNHKGKRLFSVSKQPPVQLSTPSPTPTPSPSLTLATPTVAPPRQSPTKLAPAVAGEVRIMAEPEPGSLDELRQIRAARFRETQAAAPAPSNKAKRKRNRKKKAKPVNNDGHEAKAFADMTEEEALEAALSRAQGCQYLGCSKFPGFPPFTCPYCSNPFCEKHRLPQDHGCAQKARDEHIKRFDRKHNPITMTGREKSTARKKLAEKVSEMGSSRTKEAPKSGKAKRKGGRGGGRGRGRGRGRGGRGRGV